MKGIFLYILISGGSDYAIQYPTMKECNATLTVSKFDNSHGAENESSVVMFCGPDKSFIRHSGNDFKIMQKKQ